MNKQSMARGVGLALAVGTMVMLAGCGPAAGVGGLVAAVALVLGVAGCSSSHVRGGDRDGDGHGSETDCDDDDATVHPGADEQCIDFPMPCSRYGGDGRDNDCDMRVDEGCPISTCNPFPDAGPIGDGGFDDLDRDGYPVTSDCNDSDASVHPGANESCCDGVDSDCDGMDDPVGWACNCVEDYDRDGYGGGFGGDCNDTDATIHPGATELCGECNAGDGVDQNCDGALDEGCMPILNCAPDADGDGYDTGLGGDCNDMDPSIHPGATEECFDGQDDDCDGAVDEEGVPPDGCLIINGMRDAEDDGTALG